MIYLFAGNKKPVCLVLAALLFLPGPAYAVDAPPPGAGADVQERKLREEVDKELVQQRPVAPPPVKVEKKPEAAAPAPKFYLRRVVLEGDVTFPPEIFQPLIKRYLDREIDSEGLKKMNNALEAEYRTRGYLAVIYAPPQKVQDGTITLRVVTSRMGTLSVDGNEHFGAGRTKFYWRIPKNEVLKIDKINQSVMHMNDNPDRRVRPILKAGKEPKTTDVVLKVEDRLPMHAGFSFDNKGVKTTGKNRPGFTARHNNLMGLDDIFLIGTAFGTSFGALYMSHLIPITSFGTRLIWGFSHSHVTPEKELEGLGISGLSQTYSISVRQKIFRTERRSLDFFVGLDFKEKVTRVLNAVSIWDRLRVFSTGLDFQSMDSMGYWFWGVGVDFGVSPHGDGFLMTSRQAESNFIKYGMNAERRQKLFKGTYGIVRGSFQVSPDKLTPQEEIFLGGADTVRGYPESDYGADQGFYVQNEFWVPLFFVPKTWRLPRFNMALHEQVQFLGFVDYGYGTLHGPSPTEGRTGTLLGTGAGINVNLSQHASARVEWGVALADHPVTEGGISQLHFRLKLDV